MTRTGRGPEGTPAQWYHFAEFVRRALHAAADQVEPQADGLEPIRARIPAGPAAGPAPRDRQPARWRRRRPGTRRSARRGGPGTGAQRP
jgi:hypothetical protein